MASSSSSPELSPGQVERNLLNLGIWNRVFDLIVNCPYKTLIQYGKSATPHQEASTTDKVPIINQPRILLYAEALTEDRLKFLAQYGHVNDTGQIGEVVVSVGLGEETSDEIFGTEAARYQAYSLYGSGRLDHHVYVGFSPAERPTNLSNRTDIGLIGRHELLDKLMEIDSIS